MLMPIFSKKYILDNLVGRIAMAYRADIIDVAVIISTSSNRVAPSQARSIDKSSHRSSRTIRSPRSDFQEFLPPAPMLFLEVAN